MKNKKTLFIFLLGLVFVLQGLKAQFPFQEKGRLDYFGIYLFYSTGTQADKVFIRLSDTSSPKFVLLEDGIRFINEGSINFYTFSSDGVMLSKDGRPFNPLNGVYADFPVGLEIVKDDTYRFNCSTVSKELALAVMLIDKTEPANTTDLLRSDQSIRLAPGKYAGRFVLRVFAAEVLKPSQTTALWNDPAAWMTGHVPAPDAHVVIPQESKVAIPAGANLTLGWLSDWGGTLENNGTLTVNNQTEIREMELP